MLSVYEYFLRPSSYDLVNEFAELRTDNQLLVVTSLNTAYNLSVDTEALRDLDHLLSMLWREVNLETMTHIEHLVHLSPISAALLVNRLEERWYREEVVLDHADIITNEVKDLCLCTA